MRDSVYSIERFIPGSRPFNMKDWERRNPDGTVDLIVRCGFVDVEDGGLTKIFMRIEPPVPRVIVPLTIPKQLRNVTLYPYQVEGFSWMASQEEDPDIRGGILADEMGMGKTIETLTLLLAKRESPTLIICPVSTLSQWEKEIRSKVQRGSLRVFTFYGKCKLPSQNLRDYDVVLTTYTSVLKAYSSTDNQAQDDSDSSLSDVSESSCATAYDRRQTSGSLFSIAWARVVLDEGHRIRNRRSRTTQAIVRLQAKYRWCLTGTPFQNVVDDIHSLVRFLALDPYGFYFCRQCDCKCLFYPESTCVQCGHSKFSHFSFFERNIVKPAKGMPFEYLERLLRPILDKVLLRRTKAVVGLTLPPLVERICEITLSEEEHEFHGTLHQRCLDAALSLRAAGVDHRQFPFVLSLILKMRQALDHPSLAEFEAGSALWRVLVNNPRSPTQCFICCETVGRRFLTSKGCSHIFHEKCLISLVAEDPYLSKLKFDCIACYIDSLRKIEPSSCLALASRRHGESSLNEVLRERKSSSKVDAVIDELRKVPESSKILIFSQFTRMLDIIACKLSENHVSYSKFNGSHSLVERTNIVRDFNEGHQQRVLLISLKAGGEGLNLQRADTVFLVDPWWNPAVELQAIQRVHRIGQGAARVSVVRFITPNTIEERIHELQTKKRLAADALVDSSIEACEKLNMEDITFLLACDRNDFREREPKRSRSENEEEPDESEVEYLRSLSDARVPFQALSRMSGRSVCKIKEILAKRAFDRE